MSALEKLITQAEQTHRLTREELITLLTDPQADTLLFAAAARVRKANVWDGVYLRGLIEFSNYCKNNCCYCGIRRDNSHAERYRLTPQEILQTARLAQTLGYKTVVLQSGEDPWFTADKMCEIIRQIKQLGLVITLSIGEKTREEYAAYRQAGAQRYLLRIETTDVNLYEKLDPGMRWHQRAKCLRA